MSKMKATYGDTQENYKVRYNFCMAHYSYNYLSSPYLYSYS